jgi:hypothetical protein
MMENNVMVGENQADGSDTPEVNVEQVQENNETVQNVGSEETTEFIAETPVIVEASVSAPLDSDEQILNDMFESGKTDVTTSELITAGFDTSRIGQYTFVIGQFKLTRLLLVSPYKIEKV